jgi:Txe/YoeB family toxin of toxin-antitoxin system
MTLVALRDQPSSGGTRTLPPYGAPGKVCRQSAGPDQGYWSRRITDEHRLVYKIADDDIRIAACRYHYER